MSPELTLTETIQKERVLVEKQKEIILLRRIKELGLNHEKDQFRFPFTLNNCLYKLNFIPGRFLPVVCAENNQKEIVPTPFGHLLKIVHKKMEDFDIEGYFILTPGAANEAVLTAKPPCKRRMPVSGNLKIEDYDTTVHPPTIDGDLVLILNTEWPTDKVIQYLFRKTEEFYPLELKIFNSKARKTTRIEIGNLAHGRDWRRYWFSAGHINVLDPEFSGRNYETLEQLVNARDSNDHYILLIPTNTKEGFVGIDIRFPSQAISYPAIYFKQETKEGKITTRVLKPAVLPSFETAFPIHQSFPEAYALTMHLLKSCTWENCFPLISAPEETNLSKLSLKTSLQFAQKIVFPLVKNPSLVVTDATTMRQATDRILYSFMQAVDGDPLVGLLYFLSAGEKPTSLPIYGMGFIDNNGLFPHLFKLLHQNNRLDKLIRTMNYCPFGQGWTVFVNFLYEELDRNLHRVVKLLTPTFCNPEIYPTLVENFVKRSLEKVPGVGIETKYKNYMSGWFVEKNCF